MTDETQYSDWSKLYLNNVIRFGLSVKFYLLSILK